MKYNVYMVDDSAIYLLASFEDYDEACEFCQAHNYCYTDENGFVWDLELVEIKA